MMKRFHQILLLTLLFSVGTAPTTHAQFWKKWFGKEHTKKEEQQASEERKNKSKDHAPLFSKKKVAPDYPPSVKKDHYRIDILIPLYLDRLVRDSQAVHKEQPAYVLPAIHFYEGLKMAADTLRGLGYKMDIYVHDITGTDEQIRQLIRNPGFNQTDLIIGFVQSEHIPRAAAFAKEKHINFLSALSPSDAGITENPYFILVQPTLNTHIHRLVEDALDKYSRQPKFLLYQDQSGVQKEARSQLEEALAEVNYTSVSCSIALHQPDSLRRLFDSTQINVVFVNIFSPELTEPVLKALSQLGAAYRFAVFGMPSWKALPGLTEPGYYANLSIFYTNPFYFNSDSGVGHYIVDRYKAVYGRNPTEMVYRGYETLYWMAGMLEKYGPVFDPHISDARAAPFTRYKIKETWSAKNDFLFLENQNLHLYKYQNGYLTID